MIRPLAGVILAAAFLSACSSGGKSASGDPNAGLDPEIVAWHTALEATNPACKTKVDGHGCESFEVMCKAMQTITPEEAKAGVTAKVVAAMTFSGRSEDGSSGKPGSAFAMFSKSGGKWTRAEAKPVNMSTCAPL